MDAKILALSDALLAVDKPAGLSLATPLRDPMVALNRLWSALPMKARKATGPAERWRLLHRLDVTTSGVVVLAREGEVHRAYSTLWQAGAVDKRYLALAWGEMAKASGRFADPLAPDTEDRRKMRVSASGKRAATRYLVLASNKAASLVEVTLETGRTHQVRVHFAHSGHPLLGDDLYGKLRDLPPGIGPEERRNLYAERTLLHAWRVALPETEFSPATTITAPIPPDFGALLSYLKFPAPEPPPES